MMKIEFLPHGSDDCPLIRLFDYRNEEITQLNETTLALATGSILKFSLELFTWTDSIDDCEFVWRLSKNDRGVNLPSERNRFAMEYTPDGWLEVAEKLASLEPGSNGFQWLTNEGEVRVLISPTGLW